MTSPRRAATVLVGVLLGAGVAGPAWADDGATVFCLGHQRSRLVDTAVMLGLVDRVGADEVRPRSAPATTRLTLEKWRSDEGGDFDQACEALIASVQLEKSGRAPGPGPLQNVLTLLVPLVAGSLLTWLIGLQMAVFTGRQSLAAALRASARLLRNEAEALVLALTDQKGGTTPSTDRLWRARADLVTQLEQVRALRGGWTVPRKVADKLYDKSFLERFAVAKFRSGSDEARAAAEKAAMDAVQEITQDVEDMSLALQRPFRRHPEMTGATS
ncbi:hypothetical protein [Actinoplanes solisilvae]|uniref:hypothetical protein n=1 Tax=Actinoplanes solisilvae TaxID=2486853 RepID=UPI000FD833F2|nr:hypothetical protein [Actinoplanes solisilvae]